MDEISKEINQFNNKTREERDKIISILMEITNNKSTSSNGAEKSLSMNSSHQSLLKQSDFEMDMSH